MGLLASAEKPGFAYASDAEDDNAGHSIHDFGKEHSDTEEFHEKLNLFESFWNKKYQEEVILDVIGDDVPHGCGGVPTRAETLPREFRLGARHGLYRPGFYRYTGSARAHFMGPLRGPR